MSRLRSAPLAALFAAAVAGCNSAAVPPASPDRPIGDPPVGIRRWQLAGGDQREYWVHFPIRRGNRALPLVISLHGHGAGGRTEMGRWPLIAESEGVIVCCPDSLGSQSGKPHDYPVDEENLLAILDEVRSRYPVDPRRILLTGYSGGALSALWTAMRHPRLFAGMGLRSPSFPHALSNHPDWVAAAHGLPIRVCYGEYDRDETREDVDELERLFRSNGHSEPRLVVEKLRWTGHDGNAGLPRIMEWFRALPDAEGRP